MCIVLQTFRFISCVRNWRVITHSCTIALVQPLTGLLALPCWIMFFGYGIDQHSRSKPHQSGQECSQCTAEPRADRASPWPRGKRQQRAHGKFSPLGAQLTACVASDRRARDMAGALFARADHICWLTAYRPGLFHIVWNTQTILVALYWGLCS